MAAWVVFEGISGDSNNDIFYETSSGANRTRITCDPGVDFDPVWRPCGISLGNFHAVRRQKPAAFLFSYTPLIDALIARML